MNTLNLKKEEISSKGITLIALVITIIVLLILAGISIAMLTGENGILTKADTARNETERADIIESARVKILEKQTENLGSLTEEELTNILTPEYGTLSDNDEETVLEKTLTTTDSKYQIPVKEIWNGKFYTEKREIAFTLITSGSSFYSYEPINVSFTVPEGTTWMDFFVENRTLKELVGFMYGTDDRNLLYNFSDTGGMGQCGRVFNVLDWENQGEEFAVLVDEPIKSRRV